LGCLGEVFYMIGNWSFFSYNRPFLLLRHSFLRSFDFRFGIWHLMLFKKIMKILSWMFCSLGGFFHTALRFLLVRWLIFFIRILTGLIKTLWIVCTHIWINTISEYIDHYIDVKGKFNESVLKFQNYEIQSFRDEPSLKLPYLQRLSQSFSMFLFVLSRLLDIWLMKSLRCC
jgi:hypothetical protein